MSNTKFERKQKEDKPVVAICYDFDKTLSPTDMQAQGFIQKVADSVDNFWKESNGLAENNDMDQNLAYMFTMQSKAEGKELFTKDRLKDYGSKVELFPGVETWFKRIKEYGIEKGVIVEHYIISSGLKEMIEGTKIAKEFERIYASSFMYNDKNVAIWPSQVINYTNKTQFLFRIEKGVLDINDPGVNEAYEPEEIRIPFRNMIYIGDSDTDIPCMKLINSNGGHSIGVYNSDKTKVFKMLRENRIKYFAKADYNNESELDLLIKTIIDRTAENERLENIHYKCKKECYLDEKQTNENVRKKRTLIYNLENSDSFRNSHEIISELTKIDDWTPAERSLLIEIGVNNSQVWSILKDPDIKLFYTDLISKLKQPSENSKKIEEKMNKEV